MAFKPGDHVWADLGDGPTIVHVLDDDGDKVTVQKPDGNQAKVAHREPADRDEDGSGGTCWSL